MKVKVNKTVYLAGKMRGCVNNNFEAFDKARDLGKRLGYIVISPADIDRADGNFLDNLTDKERQRIYAKRDCYALIEKCTHIAMLPGWEESVGAKAEYHLALWLQLEILGGGTFEPLKYKYRFTMEEEVMNV